MHGVKNIRLYKVIRNYTNKKNKNCLVKDNNKY